MPDFRNRRIQLLIFFSALLSGISVLAAVGTLRGLGGIVGLAVGDGGGKFNFPRIFAQTADAALTVHFLLPLFLGVLFFTAARWLAERRSRALAVTAVCVLFLILFLAAFLASLLLTQVNGIRFWDLLAKLLPLIDKL